MILNNYFYSVIPIYRSNVSFHIKNNVATPYILNDQADRLVKDVFKRQNQDPHMEK